MVFGMSLVGADDESADKETDALPAITSDA